MVLLGRSGRLGTVGGLDEASDFVHLARGVVQDLRGVGNLPDVPDQALGVVSFVLPAKLAMVMIYPFDFFNSGIHAFIL